MQRPDIKASAVFIKLYFGGYPFENSGYASIPSSEVSKPAISSSSLTRIPMVDFRIVQTIPEVTTTNTPTIWSFLLLYLVLHSLRFCLTFFPLYISVVWVLLNTLKGSSVYAP